MPKFVLSALVLGLLSSSTSAFSVSRTPAETFSRRTLATLDVQVSSNDSNENERLSRRDFASMLGVTGLVSIMSLDAHSANAMVPSSSMTVAETIKTLDMALPSYGDISSATATVEAEEYKQENAVRAPRPQREKKQGGGGSPMGKVLPSMNKSGPKQKAAAAPAKKAPRPAKKKEDDADDGSPKGVEFVDMTLPSYGGGSDGKKDNPFAL